MTSLLAAQTPDIEAIEHVQKKSLAAKLAEVMAAIHHIPKRGRNDFHKYDYATEADIVAAIRQQLAQRFVMLIPSVTKMYREAVGEKGSVLTTLEMEFTFMDGETGECISRPWMGAGTDKDDKGLYKAMTGGEKYFLLKTFLIPTGDDPEQEPKASKAQKGYVVEALTAASSSGRTPALHAENAGSIPAAATTDGPGVTQHGEELPDDGQLYIVSVQIADTKNVNVKKATVTLSDGRQFTTIKPQLQSLCETLCAERVPIALTDADIKATKWGNDLLAIHRAHGQAEPVEELTADTIPF